MGRYILPRRGRWIDGRIPAFNKDDAPAGAFSPVVGWSFCYKDNAPPEHANPRDKTRNKKPAPVVWNPGKRYAGCIPAASMIWQLIRTGIRNQHTTFGIEPS